MGVSRHGGHCHGVAECWQVGGARARLHDMYWEIDSRCSELIPVIRTDHCPLLYIPTRIVQRLYICIGNADR